MNLDPALLEIVVCPGCHGRLEPHDPAQHTSRRPGRRSDHHPDGPAAGELVCTSCGLAYPVRDDIPVLLIDQARPAREA